MIAGLEPGALRQQQSFSFRLQQAIFDASVCSSAAASGAAESAANHNAKMAAKP